MRGTSESLASRFWPKVQFSEGCWEWLASKDNHGYGQIGFGRGMLKAHRAAWMLARCHLPKGKFLCHRCDNPGCVRPSHLFIGTQASNMTDKAAKGRAISGHYRLTWEQVQDIRRRYRRGVNHHDPGNSFALATEFGVGRDYIGQIVRDRKLWKKPPAWRRDLNQVTVGRALIAGTIG